VQKLPSRFFWKIAQSNEWKQLMAENISLEDFTNPEYQSRISAEWEVVFQSGRP